MKQKLLKYLQVGGLFNPELMEHQKVRDMIIESIDSFTELEQELARFREENDKLKEERDMYKKSNIKMQNEKARLSDEMFSLGRNKTIDDLKRFIKEIGE